MSPSLEKSAPSVSCGQCLVPARYSPDRAGFVCPKCEATLLTDLVALTMMTMGVK